MKEYATTITWHEGTPPQQPRFIGWYLVAVNGEYGLAYDWYYWSGYRVGNGAAMWGWHKPNGSGIDRVSGGFVLAANVTHYASDIILPTEGQQ